jgi:hypothetical protein
LPYPLRRTSIGHGVSAACAAEQPLEPGADLRTGGASDAVTGVGPLWLRQGKEKTHRTNKRVLVLLVIRIV